MKKNDLIGSYCQVVAVSCIGCHIIILTDRLNIKFCKKCSVINNRERMTRYCKIHGEECRARSKKYAESHKEYVKNKNKEFQENNKDYIHNYYMKHREKIIQRSRDYYKKHRPKKFCRDCKKDITELYGNRVRCVSCQNDKRRRVNTAYGRIYRKKYKNIVNDRNECQLGTIAMKTRSHLIRDDEGKPNWKAEAEEVKKLKQLTYKRKRIYGISKGDIVRGLPLGE